MRGIVGSMVFATALASLCYVVQAETQQAAADTQRSFDVASIKENKTVSTASRISAANRGRFLVTNSPLRFVVLYAYQLMGDQLVGVPEWTSAIGFDITATYAPEIAPTEEDVRLLVQRLLADRFGFKAHSEKRTLSSYSLVIARKDAVLGPGLVRSTVDCEGWRVENPSRAADARGSPPSNLECVMRTSRRSLMARTKTIAEVAGSLQAITGRRVVDQTGLTGTFNVDMQWSPTDSDPLGGTATGGAVAGDGVSLFTALQEQLGLRLVPGRTSVDVLVVDAIKRPDPD